MTSTSTATPATTPAVSVDQEIRDFVPGFEQQIGARLAGVFATEQADLNAAGVPDDAVAIGRTVPDAALIALDGATVHVADVLDGRAGVLVFYRGSWCPFCNIALRHYQEQLAPALAERGVALAAISPQSPDAAVVIVENGGLDFPVLSDTANALVRELGILTEPSAEAQAAHTDLGFDVADSNADDSREVPFPTVVVVDADRRVVFADVHVDYTTRTEVPAILAAVDALSATRAAD